MPLKHFLSYIQKDHVGCATEWKDAGASATKPGEIPLRGWMSVLRRAGSRFLEDRIMSEGAAVTFYALLALLPAIATFSSIYGLFHNPASLVRQSDSLGGLVPGGGIEIVKSQIALAATKGHKALGLAAIFGAVFSLWSANSGIKSLFDALNVVYHEQEKRSFVRRTIISFAFTLGAIAVIVAALVTVVTVPMFLHFVGLGPITALLLTIARWPALLLLVGLALAVIYRYGPSRNKARWQWVSWGGFAAALAWIASSLLFSFYAANFGSFNKTYGSLGAVVGFMTWIWISSIVVLMGAELNAELEQQTARGSTIGPETPEGTRGGSKADIKT